MTSKKERNHYDLKEIENYCITKSFSKDWLKKSLIIHRGQRIEDK